MTVPEATGDLLGRLSRLDGEQLVHLWELFTGEPAPQVPVAFAVAAPGAELDALDVRRRLLDLIPRSNVPTHLAVVRSLPRDAQGKQDRAALAKQVVAALAGERDEDALGGSSTEETIDAVEDLVRHIWAIHLPGVSTDRRIEFFRSGGDSITAIRALTDLNERLETTIRPVTMFRFPRSDLFADHLDSHQETTGLDADQLRSRARNVLDLIGA